MPYQTTPIARKAPIVAAVDGSDLSFAAAEFAAAEARQRHLPLLLMHCFMWPTLYPPLLDPDPSDPGPHHRAERLLEDAAEQLRGKHPELDIDARLRNGPAAAMLADTSAHASMVVLGHRGSGGFAGLHVGSVAIHTAAHAQCPVAVVRGQVAARNAPVVVGVDGSPESRLAQQLAFDTARAHHAPLRVVAVWPPSWALPPHLEHFAHSPAVGILIDQLGSLPAHFPEVVIEPRLVLADSAAGALIAEARNASVVIVGSRGLGGLRGILLGSVGRALIAHSPCPVIVARGPAHHSADA